MYHAGPPHVHWLAAVSMINISWRKLFLVVKHLLFLFLFCLIILTIDPCSCQLLLEGLTLNFRIPLLLFTSWTSSLFSYASSLSWTSSSLNVMSFCFLFGCSYPFYLDAWLFLLVEIVGSSLDWCSIDFLFFHRFELNCLILFLLFLLRVFHTSDGIE